MTSISLSEQELSDEEVWRAGAALTGRVLIAFIFFLSGISKASDPAGTIAYISSAGLPTPTLAYGIALIVELGASALLILGVRTRMIATLLAVFTLATACGFHTDFADINQFNHFFKNISIIGGLFQIIAFGGGRFALNR